MAVLTHVTCPSCSASLDVPDKADSQKMRCAYCSVPLRVISSGPSGEVQLAVASKLGALFFVLPLLLAVGVFAALALGPGKEKDPTALITAVRAEPTTHDMGVDLRVTVTLKATSDMPFVSPQVDVRAVCDGHASQSAWAFFDQLSDLKEGAERTDSIDLYHGDSLERPPQTCELRLHFKSPAALPETWCYRDGQTSKGACGGK